MVFTNTGVAPQSEFYFLFSFMVILKPFDITNAFKRCGMYNALDGSESHLIKIRKYAYTAPAKEDKPEEN